MKLWIARNRGGSLWLFDRVPFVDGKCWYPQTNTEAHIIDPLLFPEVTWENSPQEIEFKLIDICKSCENHWIDFPLPLEQAESHCKVVDEKVGFGKMNEVVPYPCLQCPFNCYSKRADYEQ